MRTKSDRQKLLLSIDARPVGLQPNVRLAFDIMNHYNTKGRSHDTSTTFLVNAYREYKKPHNDRIVEFMKDYHLMGYIVKKYNFVSREKIINFLKYAEVKEVYKVPPATRKFLTFYKDDPNAMELYDILSKMNNKERALVISGVILYYARLGMDEYYLDMAGKQFVQNLVNEYNARGPEIEKDADFNRVLDLILFLGSDAIKDVKDEEPAGEQTLQNITDSLLNG